ncbi:hypothetical protein MA16_Dca007167 [Dendrobium catenatum]|uniref:Reverse transcriptase RNase H-like domain-containing protein n=1 Tax=Dendrobium catenatum TaxID=906689 RepID=A0A2I0W420_9ASPA|nr:hypothetical protein MA16_Dca007167 [Dendrobium catenatum]
MPVRKKNGQIQIFVDYRDLNKACPKDEFPLSIPELMVDTTALNESLGALLAQVNDEGKESVIYYLSRRLLPTEIQYPSTEKHYLALVFAAQKLRHYMLSHSISLISRVNPLQYLMT